jgi:hypothetical protein
VEAVRPLDELRSSGAVGLALTWSATSPPEPEAARAVAALCAAHPGPAPVLVEWADEGGNGGEGRGASARPSARLRSRSLRVEPADDLLAALRGILGPERVHLVKTS